MKLSHARIITKDVPALARFYQHVTGIAPVGNDDYQEIRTPAGILAIGSQRSMELYGAGAAVPASNRSAIVEFQVEDRASGFVLANPESTFDRERARIASVVSEFALEQTDQPWGNRSMLFRDPDGNLINFFTPKRQADPAPRGGTAAA
jgi:catechol 2,3-dioxygenase-like lactoylglutathione lyase family enzyme